MILTIEEDKNGILNDEKKTSAEIPIKDITSNEIQNLISQMAEVLVSCGNGVGLAAPQIGVSKRIFLALKKVFYRPLQQDEKRREAPAIEKVEVYINPRIINTSKEISPMHEGCLSVPNEYGEVMRHEKVTIRAYNEKGRVFERGASDLHAQIFQHEIDHLNGILFIQKAKNLKKEIPGKNRSSKTEEFSDL